MSTYSSVQIPTGSNEPVVVLVVDANGDPLTGKSDIKIQIRRRSNGEYFDWSDSTFKAYALVTSPLLTLVEVSAVASPGEYELDSPGLGHDKGFDTSNIVNPLADDHYFVTAIQDGGSADAANMPQIGEIRVGGIADSIEVESRHPVVF